MFHYKINYLIKLMNCKINEFAIIERIAEIKII